MQSLKLKSDRLPSIEIGFKTQKATRRRNWRRVEKAGSNGRAMDWMNWIGLRLSSMRGLGWIRGEAVGEKKRERANLTFGWNPKAVHFFARWEMP